MPKKSPFHAELRKAAWSSPTTFAFTAWVYPTGKDADDWSVVSAWLENSGGGEFPLPIKRAPDALANENNKLANIDASLGAFETTIDFRELSAFSGARGRYTFKAALDTASGREVVTLAQRYRWGSARTLHASEPLNGYLLTPDWGKNGLSFSFRRPTVSCRHFRRTPQGFALELDVQGNFLPKSLELCSDDGSLIATSGMAAGKSTVHMRLGPKARQKLRSGTARIYATDGLKRRLVHAASTVADGTSRDSFGQLLHLSRGPAGVLRMDRTPEQDVRVESIDVQNDNSPLIRIVCSHNHNVRQDATTVDLVGSRANFPGRIADLTPTSFAVEFRLLTPGEARGATLPSGGYRFRLQTNNGKNRFLTVSEGLQADLYVSRLGPLMNVRAESTPEGEFYLHVGAPKAAEELGAYNRARLARESAHSAVIAANDFYFESWFGKSVSDNQLPLIRETQMRRPDAKIRVGVIDYSVAVPAGTIPIIIGTKGWWQALHNSKYVISNSWLPNGFKKQPGQIVIQTWHGTPLKFLGLDRADAGGPGRKAKLTSEANEWDLLVSQNQHSSASFRSAYGYEGEIAEVGYPRNDDLVNTSDQERRRIRHSLGLADGEIAVLYAPTWRESDKSTSDFLDVATFAQKLGNGHRILLRGHSVTLRRGSNIDVPGVLDVTRYPNATELMIAADVLVTDYSSIMFDFTVTGKPLIFFTPDFDEYTGGGRGIYFDLVPPAPGPMSTTQEELLGYIHTLDQVKTTYSSAYESWQQRFNAWDDGHSSRKLMDRVFEIGRQATSS